MDPNRSAVLYARISAQASPQRLAQVQQELVAAVAYARRQGLRVLDALIDRYGTRRTPRPELEKAIRLCGESNACLVIPSIGKLAFDPSFYEQIHFAGVKLVVLEDRRLTHDSVLWRGRAGAARRP